MAEKYEPGRVAMVAYDDKPERPMMRIRYRDRDELAWVDGDYRILDRHGRVDSVRPLVVLDLTPDETEATLHVLGDAACDFENNGAVHSLAVINRLRDQIREQTRPPKPSEPQGLGAVVEDASGAIWVLVPRDGNAAQTEWVTHHSTCRTWGAIDAVRVLSDGWEPKP